jgi:hypothetical protein
MEISGTLVVIFSSRKIGQNKNQKESGYPKYEIVAEGAKEFRLAVTIRVLAADETESKL